MELYVNLFRNLGCFFNFVESKESEIINLVKGFVFCGYEVFIFLIFLFWILYFELCFIARLNGERDVFFFKGEKGVFLGRRVLRKSTIGR